MPTFFNFNNRKGVFMIPAGATKSPTPAPPSFSNTKSLAFDGVDEYISLKPSDVANTGQFSISFWINGNTAPTSGFTYLFSTDTYNLHTFWVVRGNDFVWSDINGVRKTLATNVLDGSWHHILVIFNPTGADQTIRCYKDGGNVVNVTTDFRYQQNPAGALYIGPLEYLGNRPSYSGFSGNLDEIGFFNQDMDSYVSDLYNGGTPANLNSLAVTPDNWYRCGDNSTYQTPQILMPSNENKNKVSNWSLQFDGVDDYIDIGNPTELQLTGNFTFSAWIKTSASGSTQVFIGKDQSATERSYLFLVTSAGNLQLVIWRSGSAKVVTSTSTLNDGNWHNAIAINDGTNLKLYIDGVADGTLADGGSVDNTTANFNIGRRSYSTVERWFNGSIDEVAIWNSDQSANISSIYNGGEPTTITGSTAYWKLGEQATFSTNWTVPDQVGSNDGTSANMTIEDRVGDAPNSSNNAVSFNMEAGDIDNNVPT
jgi:hypothetical protein